MPLVSTMSRPPRIVGFSYIGAYRYLITCCMHLRGKLFLDGETAVDVLAQFRRTAAEDHFAVVAYCVMPDHVHLLVEGLTDASDLRRFIRVGKQRAAHAYCRLARGRLWQDGYHDRTLRNEDDTRTVARYVVMNPVRAGLVTSATEWSHSGSDVWSIDEILAD